MIYGVVYKTTNLINGKTYIGQTISKGAIFERYLGSGLNLHRAVRKYGAENFEKEILCECSDKDQLNRLERLYIKLLKPDYNIASGGRGGNLGEAANDKHSKTSKGKPKSEEHKQKLREANIGKKHNFSEESLRIHSEKRKIAMQSISKETRHKMQESFRERFKEPEMHEKWSQAAREAWRKRKESGRVV